MNETLQPGSFVERHRPEGPQGDFEPLAIIERSQMVKTLHEMMEQHSDTDPAHNYSRQLLDKSYELTCKHDCLSQAYAMLADGLLASKDAMRAEKKANGGVLPVQKPDLQPQEYYELIRFGGFGELPSPGEAKYDYHAIFEALETKMQEISETPQSTLRTTAG